MKGIMDTTATPPPHCPPPATATDVTSENEGLHREGDGGASLEQNAVSVVAGSGSGYTAIDEDVVTARKKRGRPRKYDVEVNGVSLAWPPPQPRPVPFLASPPPGSFEKRGRGRPRGSGKLQLLASLGGFAAETAGGSFTPHVITVHIGEDIVTKILTFSQKGPRSVCILSAIGSVSSVTIYQPSSSGGILRYEGRFEILSLSGSFTHAEMAGGHRKGGMLSVSLAKPDGRVFGGVVAGSLIAAAPIQLIVASFKQSIYKELKVRQSAESSATAGAAIQIIRSTDGEENCTTPTFPLSEPQQAEDGGNTVSADQHVDLAAQNGGRQNVGQSSPGPPFSSERGMQSDINVAIPQSQV